MSDTFDHFGDAFDSLNDMYERDGMDFYEYRPQYRPRATSCQRCGAANLYWADGELTGLGGRVHKCPAIQPNADDFEVLP